MKLHTTQTQQYQTVTGYEDDWIEINAQRFDHSLLVLPELAPQPWPVTLFEQLESAHLDTLAATEPDLIILGTGERQRFVPSRLLATLMARPGADFAGSFSGLSTIIHSDQFSRSPH